ncbi:MAG: hypothetical protein K9M80_01800 [Candidatus Marinimicrobia bacterium]|nr:hypothetical protein [Candidatus Neomarinimicrobiota bacterium]
MLAQASLLKSPSLTYNDSTQYKGLGSNGITQIQPQGDSILWLGTGGGLSRVEKENFRDSVFTYYTGYEKLPKGGISAIETDGSTIWVAAVFDSSTTQGELQTGGGLSYSQDGGQSWTKLAQPIDDKNDDYDIWNGDTVNFSPITTPVQNTTWDIAIDGDQVYIVSWAGGLRRTSDNGQNWQRIPLPEDQEDELIIGQDAVDYEINPLNHQNHMGFSVIAYNDTLWVGTARGVNKGIIKNETIAWTHYSAQRGSGLSGDFVVALHRQKYNGQNVIWAVTLTAGSGEAQGISYTTDEGVTWLSLMDNIRAYEIATAGQDVYVAAKSGLYKLSEDRQHKSKFPAIIDSQTGDQILTDRIYSLHADDEYLWAGTGDGLARLKLDEDAEDQWSIYHESEAVKTDEIYAYPNPFYPRFSNVRNEKGHVRIKFNLSSAGAVWLEVYDFSMNRVYKGSKQQFSKGERYVVWNGRKDNGELVANGTYFCKLTRKTQSGTKSHWTKLMIMK